MAAERGGRGAGHPRAAVWAVAWAGALALLGAGPAAAEVTLKTSVAKVESILDAGGRVRRQLLPADEVVPGEELRYTITFSNESGVVVEGGRIVITNPLPDGTRYVGGSAGGEGAVVEYSADGEQFSEREPAQGAADGPAAETDAPAEVRVLRWTYRRDLAPGDAGEVYFHVRML